MPKKRAKSKKRGRRARGPKMAEDGTFYGKFERWEEEDFKLPSPPSPQPPDLPPSQNQKIRRSTGRQRFGDGKKIFQIKTLSKYGRSSRKKKRRTKRKGHKKRRTRRKR